MAESNATTATVQAAATSYSCKTGSVNVNPNLTGVTITTTLKCLTTVTNKGIPCTASTTGDNSVQVVQSASVTPYFMQMLGMFHVHPAATLTLNAEATAAMKGATNAQYNVALVIDTTSSMGSADPDGNCNGSQLQCAEAGAEVLLDSLTPCSAGSTSTSCKSAFDSVALFTFPNVSYNTISGDVTCTTTRPNIVAYSTPSATATTYAPTGSYPSYEVTFGASSANSAGYVDDYSSTNAYGGSVITTPANPLEIALGADTGSNCNGLQTPGGEGTYLAGAIYAAMASLTAAQTANTGSENAMIILTDGDAPGRNINQQTTFTNASGGSETLNSTGATVGNYPSMYDQCEQAVKAAQAASAAGITVYVVAYNSPTSGGCTSDTHSTTINTTTGANPNGTGIQPCTELEDMATAPADFFSDATTSNNGACKSTANPNLTLNQVSRQLQPRLPTHG